MLVQMYKNRAVALAAARVAYRQTARFQRGGSCGLWEFVIFVCWFEVCRTSKLLLGKVLILFVRSRYCGELNRGLQNLEAFFEKGFNFVRAKPPLRRAESRFAKPRNFPERETVLFFSLVRKEPKVPQRFANLWTPGTIQIFARFVILAENGRHSSSNRPRRALRGFRVSPVRI